MPRSGNLRGGGLVLLGMAVALATVLGRRLVRPIMALTSAAETLGRGETPSLPPACIAEITRAGCALETAARRRAQADEEQQKLASLVEHSSDFIGIATLDGQGIYLNDAGCRLVGIEPQDVHRTTIWDCIAEEERTRIREVVLPTILVSGVWHGEMRLRHFTSGHTVPVEVTGFVIYHPETHAPLYLATVSRDITERQRTEQELRQYAERLQHLSRRLVQTQEAERRALGRELHDEIGQCLTGLKLLLDVRPGLTEEALKANLETAQALAQTMLERVRNLALDLRPTMLDDLGLLPALLWHCERFSVQTQVHVTLRHSGLERRFPPEVETAVYRIVQEALTNVARHANAHEATVRLRADQDRLGAEIEDRGVGFDPDTGLTAEISSGLSGMRERASLLGGELTIASTPGSGTRVLVEFPLRWPSEHEHGDG